jgi:diguanylate cyclase (GGDEF)-like protein
MIGGMSPSLLDTALALAASYLGFELLRSRGRERRSAERFRDLENLAHAFAEAFEVESIAACAHEATAHLAPLERFEIYFFDERDRVREVWSSPSEEPTALPRPATAHPRLDSPFQREQLNRLTGTETAHSFAPLHLQAARPGQRKFYLPLYTGSQPVGYWELEFSEPLTRVALERLRAIYRYLTDSISSERNFRLAARDGLSGLYVRRYFDARLRGELLRSDRYGRPLSVAAFDLDHFKKLNDRHGHSAGDEAIRRFARTLQAGLREQDLCGRRGGEEFAAFLPETTAEAALLVCERIRGRLTEEPMVWEGRKISLTVSIGVTQRRSGDEVETILERADEALYRAKGQGRNRAILIS